MATHTTTTTTEVPMSAGGTEHKGGLGLDFRREAPDAYRALAALTRASALDHGLAELMKVRASQINGCAYCVDLHVGIALKAGEHQRRLHALATWRESPFFSDRERAALELTEALTRMDPGVVLPEAVVSEVAEHFAEDERSQLVVVIAGINAWNRVMAAGGDQPPPLDD
jgi:AhpD family alkylhydroperoxidase